MKYVWKVSDKFPEGVRKLSGRCHKGVRSIRTNQFITGQVDLTQVRTCQVRTDKVMTGQVRTVKVKSSQARTGQVKLGQIAQMYV